MERKMIPGQSVLEKQEMAEPVKATSSKPDLTSIPESHMGEGESTDSY